MRVVLFKVNHLGDSLVFLPVVQALRRRFPDWRLTVITAEPERALYAADLPPEQIWTAPGRVAFNHSWRRPWHFMRWWWQLRRERPDACLLSYDQGNAAHLLAWFSGAPRRIGAIMPFNHFRRPVTDVVDRTASRKIADWNWAMAGALVRLAGAADWPATPPPPDLRHLTGAVTREPGLVVIHAGARATIRRWGADRMATVGRRLAAAGHRVVWIDRPDTPLAEFPAEFTRATCDTLPALAQLLARASLFLCNNSGPMHLANALGTPLVVISGPSSYDWDPYWHRERCTVLRHTALPCIACEDSAAGTEHCANLAAPLACLHHWTVASITTACLHALQAPSPGSATPATTADPHTRRTPSA
jgi:ADP-heptose:LPS heptosyltransferase